jgi:pimeloyl-ACP methyl ester carboxylesterase
VTAARLHTYRHHDLVFEVVDDGPVDGEPVVLLHGWPQSASSWQAVAEGLHPWGFRTLAPNQRGYSPQASPPGRSSYRVPLLAADVVALIEAVDAGPVHLVGHDWGAVVAYAVAGVAPDRVRTLTTLSVPHPGAFLRSMLTSTQAFRSWYMAAFQLPGVPEWLIRRFPQQFVRALESTGQTHDRAVRDTQAIIRAGITATLDWYRALPLTDPRGIQAPVTQPTLHVYGARDTALTRVGAELNARFVTGPYRLAVLEEVSHWIPEEVPATVVELFRDHVASA